MQSPEAPVSKRNPYKIAFFLLLFIFLGVGAFLVYSNLDQGVSLTYLRVGYEDTEEDLKALMGLFPAAAKNFSRKDLVYLLRKNHPEAFIVEEPSKVAVGFLEFEFDSYGALARVRRGTDGDGLLRKNGGEARLNVGR